MTLTVLFYDTGSFVVKNAGLSMMMAPLLLMVLSLTLSLSMTLALWLSMMMTLFHDTVVMAVRVHA